MVAKILVGGGTSRPLDQPSQTTSSQASASPTGSSRPSAGRAQRRSRGADAARLCASVRCAGAGSSSVMAIARTLLARDCKLADDGLSMSSCDTRDSWPSFVCAGQSRLKDGYARPRTLTGTTHLSIRRQRNLVVDQRVERRLDVDLGVDHAGLLQRQAGGENGFALRRADPAVGQLGALLELLVDHRSGSLVTAMKVFFSSS